LRFFIIMIFHPLVANLDSSHPVPFRRRVIIRRGGETADQSVLGVLLLCHVIDSRKKVQPFPGVGESEIDRVVALKLLEAIGLVADQKAFCHVEVVGRENQVGDHIMNAKAQIEFVLGTQGYLFRQKAIAERGFFVSIISVKGQPFEEVCLGTDLYALVQSLVIVLIGEGGLVEENLVFNLRPYKVMLAWRYGVKKCLAPTS